VPKVHFLNEQVTVEVSPGTTIREVAIQQGIEIYRGMWTHINCLGNGICGRCRIWITSGSAGVSSQSLRERLRFNRVRGQMRFACQTRILADIEVRTRPIGPAVVRESAADYSSVVASYAETAAKRYVTAKEEAAAKAKAAAEKKAKAAEEKAKAAAEEKAKAAAEEKAKEQDPKNDSADAPAVAPAAKASD
jgi:ferredoxin